MIGFRPRRRSGPRCGYLKESETSGLRAAWITLINVDTPVPVSLFNRQRNRHVRGTPESSDPADGGRAPLLTKAFLTADQTEGSSGLKLSAASMC